MTVNFITSNPALDEYNRSQKEDRENRLADVRSRLYSAEARSKEADANVLEQTGGDRVALSSANLSKAETEAGAAKVEAGVQSGTAGNRIAQSGIATDQARSNLANVTAGQFEKAKGLAEGGDEQALQDYQRITGARLSPGTVGEARVKNAIAGINKRSEESYGKDRPDLQEQMRQAGLADLKRRMSTGEFTNDPIQQQMLPEGAPAPISTEKPVTVPVGGSLVRPGTGEVLHQNTAGVMTDDVLTMMAHRALQGDKSVMTNIGRGNQGVENIAKLQAKMLEVGKAQGKTPEEIGRAVALANAEYVGQVAGERKLGTQEAGMGSAAFEAKGAINLARDIITKVPRTGFLPFNQLIQGFDRKVLNPDQAELFTRTQGVINAYASVMARGANVTTDASRHRAEELLNTAYDPATYNRVLDTMQSEIDMAIQAPEKMREFYRQQRGGAQPGGSIPAPAAQRPDMMTPGNGTRPQNIQMPTLPESLRGIPGLSYNPARQMYRSPDGRVFDLNGQPVQQ